MRASDTSNALPAQHRFRADAVVLCIGPLAIAIAPFLVRYPYRGQWTGLRILLLIVSLALIAGGIASMALRSRAGDDSFKAKHLIKGGARAGVLTATLAAAMIVLVARVSQSQMAAFSILLPTSLSILPGCFFGMLATAIVAGTCKPNATAAEPSPSSPPRPKVQLFVPIALACIAGFSSVLIPEGALGTIQTNNSVPSSPPVQPRYETPAGVVRFDPPKRTAPNGTDPTTLTTTATNTLPANGGPISSQAVQNRQPAYQEQMRPLTANDPPFQYVGAFITAHHQKANRGDLNGLIEDYADKVIFFDKGTVDKSYIWRNESLSRAPFRAMSESIIYPLRIEQLAPNQFAAEYKIRWEATKKDGRRSNGISNVYLFLEQTPSGLKITSHKSNLEFGE